MEPYGLAIEECSGEGSRGHDCADVVYESWWVSHALTCAAASRFWIKETFIENTATGVLTSEVYYASYPDYLDGQDTG